MNLKKFDELMGTFPKMQLGQDPKEWRCFLEFISSYFEARYIRPIVVEIGIWNGIQRRFYKELLNAEYIGIDLGEPFAPITAHSKHSVPEIAGNSHDAGTVEKLKDRLAGRLIDLLFIDGDHSYEGVKLDYELYGPLVKHLTAFHDIYGIDPKGPFERAVHRFWNEIVEKEKNLPLVIFRKDSLADDGIQMGIGLIIKEPA